jgi:hypothetical protein
MYIDTISDINKLPQYLFFKIKGKVIYENRKYLILEAHEKKKKEHISMAVFLIIFTLGIILFIPKYRKFIDNAFNGKKITHYINILFIPPTLSIPLSASMLIHLSQFSKIPIPSKPEKMNIKTF